MVGGGGGDLQAIRSKLFLRQIAIPAKKNNIDEKMELKQPFTLPKQILQIGTEQEVLLLEFWLCK